MTEMDYVNYTTLFMKLTEPCENIIESMYQGFTNIKKHYETSSGNTFGFGDIKRLNNSIEFQYFDFSICIELKICASKEVGLIKWYRIHQDFESKPHKTLIIKDSFDNFGHIKASTESSMEYNYRNANIYFFHSLMNFCEKNDEIEFNQIVN